MSIAKLLKRSAMTAMRMPFAMAWDVISLGNMGEGSSTGRVLHEHADQKKVDDLIDALKALDEISK